jgi:hypothetical protein
MQQYPRQPSRRSEARWGEGGAHRCGALTAMMSCFLIVATCTYGCRTDGVAGGSQARQLRQAGEQFGLPVRTEEMVQLAEGGTTMFLAPAASLDTIPATRYPAGVDLGIAYLDLPVSGERSSGKALPKGFYKLRAIAFHAEKVGKVDGRIQLVDKQGRLAAELPAEVQILSLTLPPRSETRRTLISFGGGRCLNWVNTSPVNVCVCCPNGVTVCMNVFTKELEIH